MCGTSYPNFVFEIFHLYPHQPKIFCNIAKQLEHAINMTDCEEKTILHKVVEKQRVDLIECLLNLAININAKDKDGNTALHIASSLDNAEIVRKLVDKNIDELIKNNDNLIALQLAKKDSFISRFLSIKINHFFISACNSEYRLYVNYFLSLGANINYHNKEGNNCLTLSLFHNDTISSLSLIKQNITLNSRNKNSDYPIHFASALGNLRVIEEIIIHGGHVNPVNKDNYTPLHIAIGSAISHKEAVIDLLIKNGGNPFITPYDSPTFLYKACCLSYFNHVKKILYQYPNKVNDCSGADKNCPLHGAARSNNIEITKYLILKGANIFNQNNQGLTPEQVAEIYKSDLVRKFLSKRSIKLISASINGDMQNVKSIAGKNVNNIINSKEDFGYHAIDLAVNFKQYEVVQYFLERKAVIEPDFFGETALHIAARNQDCKMADLLITYGANIHYPNLLGITPYNISTNCFNNSDLI